MEKKITKYKNFIPLFMHLLKSKKNWFFLSTVIILITTLLIPNILVYGTDISLNDGISEIFLVFGIIEAFVLVFINCMVDNSFLHNDSKLAYYKSKPLTIQGQIGINIVTNIILAAFILLLLNLTFRFQNIKDTEILDVFKVVVPWFLAVILLAALSSVLTGNTIMAAAMTIFNFALPLIIYLIILFVFSILENVVIGFSSNILMEYLLNNFYRLDYIYFIRYDYNPLDITYILLLVGILALIILITLNCIKKRKNENTGNFIVFDGYKYFVSVLACLIIPALFTTISSERNVISKIIVSAIMAGLSFYVIIAIMEKSFRISKLSVKIFTISMVIFAASAGATVAFANQYKNTIPDPNDIEMAYIGSNSWFFSNEHWKNIKGKNSEEIFSNQEFIDWQRDYNLIFFTDKENIKNITELHKEILAEQSYSENEDYYLNRNIVIAYYLKDGSSLVRDYKMNNALIGTDKNKKRDELAYKILNSEELLNKKYFYLYNKEYYTDEKVRCFVGNSSTGDIVTDNIKLEDIRQYLIKDIEKYYSEMTSNSMSVIMDNFEEVFYRDKGNYNYYLNIEYRNQKSENNSDVGQKNTYEIVLNEHFENTLEYLGLN